MTSFKMSERQNKQLFKQKSEFIFNHAASPPLFSAQKKTTTMNPMRTWHQKVYCTAHPTLCSNCPVPSLVVRLIKVKLSSFD